MKNFKYKKVLSFIIIIIASCVIGKVMAVLEPEKYISTDLFISGLFLIFLVGIIYTYKQLRK